MYIIFSDWSYVKKERGDGYTFASLENDPKVVAIIRLEIWQKRLSSMFYLRKPYHHVDCHSIGKQIFRDIVHDYISDSAPSNGFAFTKENFNSQFQKYGWGF